MRTPLTLPFDGSRQRGLREQAGWTQQDLADRCTAAGRAVTCSQISRIESGRHKPSPPLYRVLVEVLEDDLLARTEPARGAA